MARPSNRTRRRVSMAQHQPVESSAQTEEERSKDEFFRRLAVVGEDMIAAHGKDFAIGALVLLARFLVEGKELAKRSEPTIDEWMKGAKPAVRLARPSGPRSHNP